MSKRLVVSIAAFVAAAMFSSLAARARREMEQHPAGARRIQGQEAQRSGPAP